MSLKRILFTGLLSLLFPFIPAHAEYWSPHIGADYKYWGAYPSINNNTDFGLLFPKVTNAYGVYIGTRVNGFFGVDFGIEESVAKRKSLLFNEPVTFFAAAENPGDAATVDIRLRDYHLDFNFYWEIARQFELFLMGGLVFLNPHAHILHLTNGVWTEFTENHSGRKWMGRYGFGAQYNVIPCLGIKTSITFDPLRRINYRGFDQNQNPYDIHPYGHATSFNLGLVYSFSRPHRTQPPMPESLLR